MARGLTIDRGGRYIWRRRRGGLTDFRYLGEMPRAHAVIEAARLNREFDESIMLGVPQQPHSKAGRWQDSFRAGLQQLEPIRTLSHDAVQLWIERTEPRAGSISQARLWASRFVDITHQDDLSQITSKHVVAFVAAIETSKEYSRKTARHGISRLHTLMSHCLTRGWITSNPFTGHKVAVPRGQTFTRAPEKAFTPKELALILANLGGLYHPSHRALVVAMAYSGARAGDLCVATVDKVGEVDVLRIEGHIKNAATARLLPITDKLRPFADTIDQLPGCNKAQRFQFFAGPWLKSLGLSKTAHALRHSWKAAAVRQGCPEHVRRGIMGHTPGEDEHSRYGSNVSLSDMRKWLIKVDPTK